MNEGKAKAIKFLKNIKKDDNVALIFHNDGDGFASGILMKNFVEKKCRNIWMTSFALGKSKLSGRILEELKNRNKVIIMDLALNALASEIELLKDKPVLYIDHHPKDIEVSWITGYFTDSSCPASKSVYELTLEVSEDQKEKEWVAVWGLVSDYGDKYAENQEFINNFLKREKISLKELKEKYIYKISSFLVYFEDNFPKAFDILDKMEDYKEVKKIYKYSDIVDREIKKCVKEFKIKRERLGKTFFYYFDAKYNIKSIVINILSSEEFDRIFVFASGFDDKTRISARCQSGKVDVAELLKKCVAGLGYGAAGGHSKTAGATILKKDLEKFKDNLEKISKEM